MIQQPISIDENCKFLKDLECKQSGVNVAMYNLICSKRDLKLFCKGIKPHRRWRLKDVKEYFGLFELNKKEDIKNALEMLYEIVNQ